MLFKGSYNALEKAPKRLSKSLIRGQGPYKALKDRDKTSPGVPGKGQDLIRDLVRP